MKRISKYDAKEKYGLVTLDMALMDAAFTESELKDIVKRYSAARGKRGGRESVFDTVNHQLTYMLFKQNKTREYIIAVTGVPATRFWESVAIGARSEEK